MYCPRALLHTENVIHWVNFTHCNTILFNVIKGFIARTGNWNRRCSSDDHSSNFDHNTTFLESLIGISVPSQLDHCHCCMKTWQILKERLFVHFRMLARDDWIFRNWIAWHFWRSPISNQYLLKKYIRSITKEKKNQINASEMPAAPRISQSFGLPWSALVCTP